MPSKTIKAARSLNQRTPRSQARSESDRDQPGTIEITATDGALIATLKRPALHNRISAAMARQLIELAEAVEDDESITTLAISGDGSCFCGGFDPDVDPKLVESLAIVSKPTIAVLNGDASDEGLELAMALDLRVASSKCRLALTQLARGELPRFGGTQRLPRLIGAA
ncbi:MAG: enoyl-CoA hydratase/isomerase family protein, partial [Candidatus Binataceae bacterium]